MPTTISTTATAMFMGIIVALTPPRAPATMRHAKALKQTARPEPPCQRHRARGDRPSARRAAERQESPCRRARAARRTEGREGSRQEADGGTAAGDSAEGRAEEVGETPAALVNKRRKWVPERGSLVGAPLRYFDPRSFPPRPTFSGGERMLKTGPSKRQRQPQLL